MYCECEYIPDKGEEDGAVTSTTAECDFFFSVNRCTSVLPIKHQSTDI